MPGRQTQNYHLNQWEPEDKVLRTDFNTDNEKIDDALAGKADVSALAALSQRVDGKADATAQTELSRTVSSHTATLNKKGNSAHSSSGAIWADDSLSIYAEISARAQMNALNTEYTVIALLAADG